MESGSRCAVLLTSTDIGRGSTGCCCCCCGWCCCASSSDERNHEMSDDKILWVKIPSYSDPQLQLWRYSTTVIIFDPGRKSRDFKNYKKQRQAFCLKVASFIGLLPVLAACHTFLFVVCL